MSKSITVLVENLFKAGDGTYKVQFADEDAIHKLKAEAWDEGCNAGHNRKHHKNMTEEQARAAWPNPYCEETE